MVVTSAVEVMGSGGAAARGVVHQVVLVPGFFGFLNLGELNYFSRTVEQLAARLQQLGVSAEVRAVSTLPTASLRSRAAT
ncbi:MAG: hypothetical protein H7138_02060, partial [Myxococcales bacterium]|nr:hypothetical protein [Myxococcales bacterium]